MSRNPFHTYPGMMQRAQNLVHLFMRDAPEVAGYQVWGHSTVVGAYGNPAGSGVGGSGSEALFTVNVGGAFRSPSLVRSGRGPIIGNTRGQTHMVYDPADLVAPGSSLLPDEYWAFLRVQENRRTRGLLDLAGAPADPVLGPVYCVPPASHYGLQRPAFTLEAIAPSGTGCVQGALPNLDENLGSAAPRPLYLAFPSPILEIWVRNISANNLLVSFGPGHTMMLVAPDVALSLTSGSAAVREVLVACPDVGGAAFTLHAVMGV